MSGYHVDYGAVLWQRS